MIERAEVVVCGAGEPHVPNAISPALTASFAFAQLLADRLEKPA